MNTIPISIGNRVALAHRCVEEMRRGGPQLLMKRLVGTPVVRLGRSPTVALPVASERPRVVSAGPRVVSAAVVVVSAAVAVVSAAGAVVSAVAVDFTFIMKVFYFRNQHGFDMELCGRHVLGDSAAVQGTVVCRSVGRRLDLSMGWWVGGSVGLWAFRRTVGRVGQRVWERAASPSSSSS